MTKLLSEHQHYKVDVIPDRYVSLNPPLTLESIKDTILTLNTRFQGIDEAQFYDALYDLETIMPTRHRRRGNRHHNLAADVSAITHFFDNKSAVSAFTFSTEFQSLSMFLLLLATECMVFFFLDLGFGRETQDQVLWRQNTETTCLLHHINAKHLIDLAAKNESKEYGGQSKYDPCRPMCDQVFKEVTDLDRAEGHKRKTAGDQAAEVLNRMRLDPVAFGIKKDTNGDYDFPEAITISTQWYPAWLKRSKIRLAP